MAGNRGTIVGGGNLKLVKLTRFPYTCRRPRVYTRSPTCMTLCMYFNIYRCQASYLGMKLQYVVIPSQTSSRCTILVYMHIFVCTRDNAIKALKLCNVFQELSYQNPIHICPHTCLGSYSWPCLADWLAWYI